MTVEDRRKCPYHKGLLALRDTSKRKVTTRHKSEKIIGKDEVPSSNLGSSSRKPLFSIEKSGFLFEKAITKSW